MNAVPPGGTIGILGGGQLGRMLALAAARLGLKAHIFAPDPEDGPAGQVSAAYTRADYGDDAALLAFAHAVDAVTTEFENVPAEAAKIIAEHVPMRPGAAALRVAQDRVTEKAFLNEAGVETARWAEVGGLDDLRAAVEAIGLPAILKTRRFGYDGKGQAVLRNSDDVAAAWDVVKAAPSILEGMVPFEREVSMIVARGQSGETACYDPAENSHAEGILRVSKVPAQLSADQNAAARELAIKIAEALDYVGVLGVEMFVTAQGVLVNEIAPRVHNTGHWTLEGCAVSQFEQQIRAVAGWPLGDTARHSDAEMTNLIGDDADGWLTIAAEPGAALHLYGKAETRPGRKMGHVTRLSRKTDTA